MLKLFRIKSNSKEKPSLPLTPRTNKNNQESKRSPIEIKTKKGNSVDTAIKIKIAKEEL